jgi:urease beta subunit
MRKARFTEEQMVAINREADREPVSVVAKRHIARSNPAQVLVRNQAIADGRHLNVPGGRKAWRPSICCGLRPDATRVPQSWS